MMNKNWLWFLFFLMPQAVWCQSPAVIDSLQKLLTTTSNKQKVDVYNQLARQYQGKDSLKTEQYVLLALKLGKKNSYPKGIVEAWAIRGHVAKQVGRYKDATQAFLQIEKIGRQYDYAKAKPIAYKGLGLTEIAQSNYEKALEYNRQALRAYQAIGDRRGVSDLENNIGIVYFKKGDYQEAFKHHFKALAIRKLLEEPQALAVTYNNIGIVYLRQGNYPKALDYYFKSLKIKEQHRNLRGMAASYNNISVIYIAQKKYKQALIYLFKALKIIKILNYQNGFVNIYNNIGLTYFNQNNVTQALDFYQRALNKSIALGNKRNIAKLNNNLSEVFIAMGHYEKAQEYAQKAWVINEQIKVKVLTANTSILLGKILYQQKQYKKAIIKLENGLRVAKEMKRPSKVQDGAKVLAKAYYALGQYKKAYEYYEVFKQMTDSLHNESNTQQITFLSSEYEFQKEKDSLKHQQTKERMALNASIEQVKLRSRFQRNIIVLVLLVLVVVLVLFLFLYQSQQRQKQLNRCLMQQGEELHQSKEEISTQRDVLAHKNTELSLYQYRISKSLRAAQLIQDSLLTSRESLQAFFSDYFVIYQPKDVVSGDFFWVGKVDNKVLLVAADCTGHGIPGAFMTLIGSKLLDTIIKVNKETQPVEILKQLNQEIQTSLTSPATEDHRIEIVAGMDAIVLCIAPEANQIYAVDFAGAKSGLLYFDTQQPNLQEIRGSRKSIGGFQSRKKTFEQHHIELAKGSVLYMGSDGVKDQHNEQRRRFGQEALRQLLEKNVALPLKEQKQCIEETLTDYMQGTEQRDDILWIGIKL